MINTVHATKTQWEKICAEAYNRDKESCQICGKWLDMYSFHPHHIVPKGRVHIDHVDNVCVLCGDCHNDVTDHRNGRSVDRLIEEKKEQLGRFYYYNHRDTLDEVVELFGG